MTSAPTTPHIDFLVLADRAEAVNGKLYMMGGGWDRLTPGKLPAAHTLGIALGVVIPVGTPQMDHRLDLSIDGPAKPELSPSAIQFSRQNPPASMPGRAVFGLEASIVLRAPGVYRIRVTIDGAGAKQVEFNVEAPPP